MYKTGLPVLSFLSNHGLKMCFTFAGTSCSLMSYVGKMQSNFKQNITLVFYCLVLKFCEALNRTTFVLMFQ